MTGTFFFPVVMKISRHNKKTANFPPEPKTDTPARQTTGTFFPVVTIFFPAATKKLPISRQNQKLKKEKEISVLGFVFNLPNTN